MKQVTTVSVSERQKLSDKMYGNIAKAVIDIDKKFISYWCWNACRWKVISFGKWFREK